MLSTMDAAVAERLEGLRGAVVVQMRVDQGFALVLAPQDAASPASVLLIGAAFSVRDPGGDRHDYVDGYARRLLGPALELLFNQEVRAASTSAAGELTLDFVSGASLRVPPDARFEAWSLSAQGTPTLVSPPGGGWPVWPTDEYGSAQS
jgi:hypothetical protein